MVHPIKKKKTAIVLSGGGSRGAYEAGIMLYLRDRLPTVLGHQPSIDIITGTSVGAINGAYYAGTLQAPERQGIGLANAWRSLEIENLITFKLRNIMQALRLSVGGNPPGLPEGKFRMGGLIDTEGLEKFVVGLVPWKQITRNIRDNLLQAIAVSTTHVGTGHTMVFLQTNQEVPQKWSRDPFVRHRKSVIGPRHVLASAALPVLFPVVRIGDDYYTDGGLRQNMPMSPAIRMGADKMLLISLRYKRSPQEIQAPTTHPHPTPLFLVGKALNALMLDSPEYDLNRLTRINAILDAGEQAYGSGFYDTINKEIIKLRSAPLRKIDPLHIWPSRDIGKMAADFVNSGKAKIRKRVVRKIIDRIASAENRGETDLLSYVLFDGQYASSLIDLGYEDAKSREHELAEFFSHDN